MVRPPPRVGNATSLKSVNRYGAASGRPGIEDSSIVKSTGVCDAKARPAQWGWTTDRGVVREVSADDVDDRGSHQDGKDEGDRAPPAEPPPGRSRRGRCLGHHRHP